jgi:hypothetical protein
MIEGFRRARRALDEFQPDLCVIWGDDQFGLCQKLNG